MFVTILTLVHVAISLIAIAAGCGVAYGLLTAKRLDAWTPLFLATTVATSVTGFLFPFERFLPSHGVGVVSLLVLPVAYLALYGHRLAGLWRLAFVVSAMLSLYLNVFVLVTQVFVKIPALKALAPTQSEPPFAVAQLVVFIAFLTLTVVAAVRFREERPRFEPGSVPVA